MLRILKPDAGKAIFAASFFLGVAAASLAHDKPPPPGDETAFLRENDGAMNKMMAAMTVKPTGDIDRDFAAMMTPHHQGAIDMAVIELRYGKNETLRRIAQEIIVDQMQEIAAMKLAIGEPAANSRPAPTQQQPAPEASEQHPTVTPMDGSSGMKH
jgi:hypothetical protein